MYCILCTCKALYLSIFFYFWKKSYLSIYTYFETRWRPTIRSTERRTFLYILYLFILYFPALFTFIFMLLYVKYDRCQHCMLYTCWSIQYSPYMVTDNNHSMYNQFVYLSDIMVIANQSIKLIFNIYDMQSCKTEGIHVLIPNCAS